MRGERGEENRQELILAFGVLSGILASYNILGANLGDRIQGVG